MQELRGPLLSLFPGLDLLGRAFESQGWCVVRGPDLLWGQSIEGWHPARGAFPGIIGGSPCQDFSKARRAEPTGDGLRCLAEFARVVFEAGPVWWLLENVPGVPNVTVPGYQVQRFNLHARDCGCPQNRLRRFQFGSIDGTPLVIPRAEIDRRRVTPCVMASEGQRTERRAWPDVCELQGLPRDFDLPGWSLGAKYRAVGNGVPIPMGRVVAAAIRDRTVTPGVRLSRCECGRVVQGKQMCATAACRKRMERSRRAAVLPP